MEKLMKFENSDIQMTQIDGKWYFELYSVGMALGQVKKNGNGVAYPRKDRIDENAENAEIKPCVRNGHKFITEEQVYDLMLEARTDKCRVFRKWLTNEVLPELNHTGTYTMKDEPKADKLYEYFDKTYNGVPVLTIADIEHITGISCGTVGFYFRKYGDNGTDYYLLTGAELFTYKSENPKANRQVKNLVVVTRTGFIKLCKAYNVKVEEPKCFEPKSKFGNIKPVVFPENSSFISNGTHQLLDNIRKEAEGLKQITYLLDVPDGFMIDTDTQQMYRKAIQGKAKRLSTMTTDINFSLSSCVNR